jgi:hypothetical protein
MKVTLNLETHFHIGEKIGGWRSYCALMIASIWFHIKYKEMILASSLQRCMTTSGTTIRVNENLSFEIEHIDFESHLLFEVYIQLVWEDLNCLYRI